MANFRPLAARSAQRPPGPAWRNKALADSPNDPDDADKPDDLDGSDNSDDSDDSLATSWASRQSRRKWSWPRFPRPGHWPQSGQFILTAYCKIAIFRCLVAKRPRRPPARAERNRVPADSADDPDDAHKPVDLNESHKTRRVYLDCIGVFLERAEVNKFFAILAQRHEENSVDNFKNADSLKSSRNSSVRRSPLTTFQKKP